MFMNVFAVVIVTVIVIVIATFATLMLTIWLQS